MSKKYLKNLLFSEFISKLLNENIDVYRGYFKIKNNKVYYIREDSYCEQCLNAIKVSCYDNNNIRTNFFEEIDIIKQCISKMMFLQALIKHSLRHFIFNRDEYKFNQINIDEDSYSSYIEKLLSDDGLELETFKKIYWHIIYIETGYKIENVKEFDRFYYTLEKEVFDSIDNFIEKNKGLIIYE